jgi:arabinose-5-phosphate isomerase
VSAGTSLIEAVTVMSAKRFGVTAVVDSRRKLKGIITDGDLRRAIEKGVDFASTAVRDVMTPDPLRIGEEELGVQALRLMEARSVTVLMVTEEDGTLHGLVHLHDLLKAGIA